MSSNETSKLLSNDIVHSSNGVAGLVPKPKSVNIPLSNFGFIPREKTRNDTGELSAQIQNLILDPEQLTPITCLVPINNRSDEVIEKELNHNPKNARRRKKLREATRREIMMGRLH